MKTLLQTGLAFVLTSFCASIALAQHGPLTAVSPDSTPQRSFFSSLQTNFPPSPVDPFPQLPLYSDGSSNNYYYDTTGFDIHAYLAQAPATNRSQSRFNGGRHLADYLGSNSPIATNYTVTTNYGNYTNFWLAISNSSTQAFVSLMSTLPGLSYEIWTNSDPGVSNWAVWQVVTASNSVTPAPPLNIISNGNLAFAAQLDWTPGTNSLPFSYTNCDWQAGGALLADSDTFCIGEPVFDSASWSDIPGQAEGIVVNTNYSVSTFTNVLYADIATNWNVVFWDGGTTTNSGSAFFFQPTNSGYGTNIFYYTYSNDAPCADGPITISVSNVFAVVDVASLAPTNAVPWTEIPSSTPFTRTFVVPVNTNAGSSTLAVYATPTPAVSPDDLPSCWSLNGFHTNVTCVSLATAASYTVVCSCGTTSLTNFIIVAPGGLIDQDCGSNAPSPLAYWSFNQPALLDGWPGLSNANDTVGSNNGVIYGTVNYTNASYSNAFNFNGSNSYISFGTNAGNFGTNNFSVDFWLETTATNQQAILGKSPVCGSGNMWNLEMSSNGAVVVEVGQTNWGTNFSESASTTAINDGYFHHLTLTRWGTNLSLYIDGSPNVTMYSGTNANYDNATNLLAGADACIAGGGSAYFAGMISEIKLSLGDIVPWVGTNDHHPLQYFNVQNPTTPWNGGLYVASTNPAKLAYNYIEADGTANINGGNGAAQFWFKPSWNGNAKTNGPGILLELGDVNSAGGGWALETDPIGSSLSFVSGASGFVTTYLTASVTNWQSNAWHQLVLDYSPDATALYIDGVQAASGAGLAFTPDLATRMGDGFTVDSDHNGFAQADGTFDELTTYNCPLDTDEVVSGYPYPAIVSQPVSQTVTASSTAYFSVAVANTNGVGYQWQLNGTNLSASDSIAGATSNVLSIADAGDANAGSYTVVVTNAAGMTVSAVATLSVNDTAELGLWYFDTTNWAGTQGQLPIAATNVQAVEAWSTNGVEIDSTNAARLAYHDVEADGAANIDCRTGSVILWFNPDWTSAAGGGSGPGVAGRLIELGSYGASNGWWSLLLGSDGNSISFCTASNGAVTTNVTGTISFESNTWHQVAVTYSASGSQLYVDGGEVNSGSGVTSWPSRSARGLGLSVGSDATGTQQARGIFAELETFNYPVDGGTMFNLYSAIVTGEGYAVYFQHPFAQSNSAVATVLGDPAQSMAILVNSTNFASANWGPFNASPTVNLGSGDGPRQVWFGFQNMSGLPSWVEATVTVDTTPPALVVTHPASGTVCRPVIQVKGYSPEQLSSITFDVSNATGVVTGQFGHVLDQVFDTNAWAFTTNTFQCYDIALAPGANSVTIHATDLAGNVSTSNYVYTLDYSGATNPAVTIYWPQDGTQVSGTNVTIRGILDDPTAQVQAQIVDASGNTNTVNAIVERSGLFWLENLPMAAGSNTVSIIAMNGAGQTTLTNLMLVQSSVGVNIDTLPSVQYLQSTVNVSGEIDTAGYTVWVNGVQASYGEDGVHWSAANVPVPSGNTAVVQASAIPNSDNGGNGSGGGGAVSMASSANPHSAGAASAEQDPDVGPTTYVESYNSSDNGQFDSGPLLASQTSTNIQTTNYSAEGSVTITGNYTADQDVSEMFNVTWPGPGQPGQVTDTSEGYTTNYEIGPFGGVPTPYYKEAMSGQYPYGPYGVTYTESAKGQMEIKYFTGGKDTGECIVSCGVSASAITDYPALADFFSPPTDFSPDIPPGSLTAGDLGGVGYDGMVYKKEQQGQTIDITVTAPYPNYSYSASPETHIPYITANSQDTEPVEGEIPEFCVGQQIIFSVGFTPPLSYAEAVAHWKLPGGYVNLPAPENGTLDYIADPTLLYTWEFPGSLDTRCWYINSPGGTVSVTVTPIFLNGMEVTTVAQGAISVYKPEATLIASRGKAPTVDLPGSVIQLDNFTYNLAVTCAYEGHADFTQIVSRNAHNGWSLPTVFTGWLDNFPFYVAMQWTPPGDFHLLPFTKEVCGLTDSPNYPLGPPTTSITDNFTDYFMFCPGSETDTNNIYVPLGTVDWSWTSSTHFKLTHWTTPTQTGIATPKSFVPSDKFPTWKKVFPRDLPWY